MKSKRKIYLLKRIRSIKYAFRGIWFLIKTEGSIQVQVFLALIITALGFHFEISATEWMIQCLIIGMVLAVEALNTGIEKLCDFVHPEHHKRIGFIKDVSAGAAGFVAVISLIIAGIIYIPKILLLF